MFQKILHRRQKLKAECSHMIYSQIRLARIMPIAANDVANHIEPRPSSVEWGDFLM